MHVEQLDGGRFQLKQQPEVFPLSMDTMALGDFATVKAGDAVWDLGCGSGALGLLLYGREATLTYTGIDLDPAACCLAEENFTDNGLPATLIQGDIGSLSASACANLVISNPPYFADGKPGTTARTGCPAESLCQAAGNLLVHKGRFALCWPTGGLVQLFMCLRSCGMEPKRLQLVAHRPSVSPKIALIEAVKGGRPGLTVLPGLFWYTEDGLPTADYLRIYHQELP